MNIVMAANNPSQAKILGISIPLFILATTAVVLRIISTKIRDRTYKLHDYLCFLSLTCLLAYLIVDILGGSFGGYGLHLAKALPVLETSLKIFWASQFFWSTSIASFRLAILLLYIEIFPKKWFYHAAMSTIVVVTAYFVACILTICLLCHPINFNWNRSIEGTCGSTVALEIFSAAFNMILDIWVVCLPLPIVWTLQMPKQKKIGISATFALGLAIAGINLTRMVQTLVCDSADFTYCALGSSLIVTGEMATGIMVACIPVLGPVFFPKRRAGHSKKYKYWGSNTKTVRNAFSGRNTISSKTINPTTNSEGKGSFQALHEDNVELESAFDGTNGHKGYNSQAVAVESQSQPATANQIGVREDVDVYEERRLPEGL